MAVRRKSNKLKEKIKLLSYCYTHRTHFVDAKLVLLSSIVLAALNWIVGSERGKLSENF